MKISVLFKMVLLDFFPDDLIANVPVRVVISCISTRIDEWVLILGQRVIREA